MKAKFLVWPLTAALLVSCAHSTHMKSDLRTPASAQEEPTLVYITYDRKDVRKDVKQEVSPEKWATYNGSRNNGAGREDLLVKMWSANTRARSTRGLRHAACFRGYADDVQKSFFDEKNPAHSMPGKKTQVPFTIHSSDGIALGLKYEHARFGLLEFRLTRCDAGKTQVSGSEVAEAPQAGGGSVDRSAPGGTLPSSDQAPVDHSVNPQPVGKAPSVNAAKGFTIEDKVVNPPATLPKFLLRADYQNSKRDAQPFAWKGLNLRDKKQALRAALLLQKYFYENMANQNPAHPDQNFIAANNKSRYWCHVPWLNVGPSGREGVHGLTKELDMKPSSKISVYSAATAGTDWGVAYFNAPGCETLGDVFGSASNPAPTPNWDRTQFKDGTVSVKILFTTADFPAIKDAYSWTANVSDVGQTERSLKKVRHVQMDISIKDSSFVGLLPNMSNWTMFGFYYDPNYDFETELKAEFGGENPLKSIPNLPAALFKMRPMGVQTGFDAPATGDTILFGNAQANGSGGRLNGPADNPRTSCMGCHATAGHAVSMVPGFLSEKMYEPFHGQPNLDFNQQVALARRNFETEVGK